MCATCGCGERDLVIHPHDHAHDHPHEHGSEIHPHGHAHEGRRVSLEQDILAKNAEFAAGNRRLFAERGIFALNLVSSPGSGKTTLLTRTVQALRDEFPVAVIGGDQQTAHDAERIRAAGAGSLLGRGKGAA